MSAANEARIIALVGASGSGKSLRIKQLLTREKPRRLVVWDWRGEYALSGANVTTCPAELAAAMRKAGRNGRALLVYRPRKLSDEGVAREFDAVCRLVQAWGSCCYVVEEISNVTRASWAPRAWKNICTEGRHDALIVMATTQSPALVDKTFLTNATTVFCGALGWPEHRKVMANVMDMGAQSIADLGPLQWYRKERLRAAIRDDLKLPKSAARR